jgi:hypothetical protein
MSPARMSASVAHKSTGGTLQSLPEPVDPVGDAPDYLTFKTVARLAIQSIVFCTFRQIARNPRVYRRFAIGHGPRERPLQDCATEVFSATFFTSIAETSSRDMASEFA